MATQFEIECALLAGASYISTRSDINKFPVPEGWKEQIEWRTRNDDSGFEAATFKNGTEVVISYSGTNPNSLFDPDNVANIRLAMGYGSAQLIQAADYYLSIKNDPRYAGSNITLTGHSLGGGLAALVGVFFGVRAYAFDQAPFANAAQKDSLVSNPFNTFTPDVAADLKNSLLANGYREPDLTGLANFLQLRKDNGGIPNSDLISGYRVEGEFLTSILPFSAYDAIGAETPLTHQPKGVSFGLISS